MRHRRPTAKLAAILAFVALAVAAAPALAEMQCTTWAHAKRPDLPWTELGDAKTWDSRAADLGYSVDRIPARRDIAVWQAGQCTRDDHGCAGHYGHVAFVVAVLSGNKIRISESNWPTGSGPRVTVVNGRGLTFIHGG